MTITEFWHKSTAALAVAWQLIARFALLPGQVTEAADPKWVMRALPVAGLIIGVSLWLASALLNVLLMNAAVAAICAALLVPAWYWWLTRAKGLTGLTQVAANWQVTHSAGAEPLASYLPLLTVQACIVLKALAVGALVYVQQGNWLILVPVLSATAFGQVTVGAQGPDRDQALVHWGLAAAITVVVAGWAGGFIAGLFAVVIAWLATPALNTAIARRSRADATHQGQATIELLEIIVLWVGVLAA